MVTMEKQKKPRTVSMSASNTTSSTTSFQNEQRQHYISQRSNLDEPAIQQLMLEPLDYNESLVTVGTEPRSVITTVSATTQSLRNLNNVCLTGLDGVLQYILIHDTVSSLSQRQQQQRIDTHTNLISSIRYSTQCLARASATMMNSNENSNIHNNHHNLTTLLSQVENLLDQHLWLITRHSDLCRVLLQMINTITRNNDSGGSFLDDAGHLMKTTTSSNNLLQHVRSEIRQTLVSLPTQLTFSNKEVEAEFYQHLESLSQLVNHTEDYHYIDENPPAYQDVTTDVTLSSMTKGEKLPQYFEQERKIPHSYSELDAVFNAIDRLSHVTPRFNNQRVERQLRIEGRHAAPKMLCDSIAQIQRMSRFKLVKRFNSAPSSSNTSTKNNDTNSTTQRRVSASTVRSDQIIENGNNNNNNNRHSLYEVTDLLVKSLHRPCFNKQRYQLTADKERDLFMNGLFNKVDRLEGRRLSNQDAEQPKNRLDELDQILNHICHSKRAQFENQRATFTVHST